MKETLSGFQGHDLGVGHKLWVGCLSDTLMLSARQFETLWQMHPEKFHEIEMYGRLVKTPRWQQAYGTDYYYTGRVNRALPIPPLLEPFIRWSRDNIDPDLNGLLLNWYDGSLGHYIGRHRDSIQNMISGAPIVTLSLGEERTFRLRSWPVKPGAKFIDFPAKNGTVFVMPWETNRVFTHEVLRARTAIGRRISITMRALGSGQAVSVNDENQKPSNFPRDQT